MSNGILTSKNLPVRAEKAAEISIIIILIIQFNKVKLNSPVFNNKNRPINRKKLKNLFNINMNIIKIKEFIKSSMRRTFFKLFGHFAMGNNPCSF